MTLYTEDVMPEKTEHWSRLYGTRMMWFVILWCVGFAAAMLTALPFRLLVSAAMH